MSTGSSSGAASSNDDGFSAAITNSLHGLFNDTNSRCATAPVDRSSTPLNLELDDLFGDDEFAALTEVYPEEAVSKKRHKATASSTTAPTVSRRRKKPKGFPKRPLSGYNIFFKQERVNVLENHSAEILASEEGFEADQSEHSNVSFQDLGKIIGKRWKALTDDERKKYEYLAHDDSLRYRREMEAFNESKRKYNEKRVYEATNGYRDEKSLPSKWGSGVISGVPEFKPLLRQSSQPLQARLPGELKDPPQANQDHLTSQLQHYQVSSGLSDSFSAPYTQQSNWSHIQSQHRPHDSPGPDAKASGSSTDTGMSYAIPPGTELYLADPEGRERKFKVHYKFYSMSRQAAETYMEHLSASAVSTPYGFTDYPPPPVPPFQPANNTRDSHTPSNSFWR